MQGRVVLEGSHGGAVLRVVLNAPPGNILDIATLSDLDRRVAAEGGSSALKTIVFEGAGANFSYGVSIEEHREETIGEMLKAFQALFRTLLRLDRVLIAIVRGQCLGGGLELVSLCHRVFAHPKARPGQPEINLGFFPPLASVILPRRCGQAVADEASTGTSCRTWRRRSASTSTTWCAPTTRGRGSRRSWRSGRRGGRIADYLTTRLVNWKTSGRL